MQCLFLKNQVYVFYRTRFVEIIAYAIDKAKEAGCTVVLNAAPAIELPEECLSKVDILVVNEVEAEFYCHEKSIQLKRQNRN